MEVRAAMEFVREQVELVRFDNPHEIIIRTLAEKQQLSLIEDNLQQIASNYQLHMERKPPEVGDHVVVRVSNGYKRAIVENVDVTINCKLTDYDEIIFTDDLFVLPCNYNNVPPLYKKVALNNVIALQEKIDVEVFQLDFDQAYSFNKFTIKFSTQQFNKAKAIYFLLEQKLNNVFCGDFCLKIDERTVSLKNILVENKCVTINSNLFIESMNMLYGNTQANAAVDCVSTIFDDEDTEMDRVGRCWGKDLNGINKTKPLKQEQTKSQQISKWINDIETPVSDSEETKSTSDQSCSSRRPFRKSKTQSDGKTSLTPAAIKKLLKSRKSRCSFDTTDTSDTESLKQNSHKQHQVNKEEDKNDKDKDGACTMKEEETSNKIKLSDIKKKLFHRSNSEKSNGSNKQIDGSLKSNVTNEQSSSYESSTSAGNDNTSSSFADNVESTSDNVESTSHNVKSAIPESNNNENVDIKGTIMTNCRPQCKCANCVDDFDFDFYEDKKVFANEIKRVDNVFRGKPKLLFKNDDSTDANLIITKNLRKKGLTKIDKEKFPNILIHSAGQIPIPVFKVMEAPFCDQIHHTLRKRRYVDTFAVQTYVWPAVMRSMDVCVVNGAKSGKSMCYIPAMLTVAIEKNQRYPYLPRDNGPVIVILCDGIRKAEIVYERIGTFLEDTPRIRKIRLFCLVPPTTKENFKTLREADIIVTIPSTLVRILSSRAINLKRLCHFVVEDVDLMLEKSEEDFSRIANAIQSMLRNRNFITGVQLIAVAERWTGALESFVGRLETPPLVCIGSYLEAAVYAKTNMFMHILKSSAKREKVLGILKEESGVSRTVVVCNDDVEVNELTEYFRVQGISVVDVDGKKTKNEIAQDELLWLSSLEGKTSVLICTDTSLETELSITTAKILINYSLPSLSWSRFTRRFKCVLDCLDSPFNTKFSKTNACKIHIFVDESNSKQFPQLNNFLARMQTKLPESFAAHCAEVERNEESQKIEDQTRVCSTLKLMGRCDKFRCRKRHAFSTELDSSDDVPSSGIVKFKLLHVDGVAAFGAKLLEVVDVNGTKSVEVTDHTHFVTDELKRSVESFKFDATDVKVGRCYAYHNVNGDTYRRCKIVKIVSVDKITKRPIYVKAKFIDDGYKERIHASLLYDLPNEYLEFPPQSVDVHLANIVPLERDTKWNNRSVRLVRKMLEEYTTNYPDAYFAGRIVLKVGGTIWLDYMNLQEVVGGETVNLLTFKRRLIDRDIVDVNISVLENLKRLCIAAGFDLPSYEIANVPRRVVKVEQAKPSWAFLDTDPNVYNVVNFSSADSPSKFYVKLQKYDRLLLDLQKDIQYIISKPFYPEIKELQIGNCYLAKDPGGSEFGRVVLLNVADGLATCFFVDYGDKSTIPVDELKYLSDDQIQKLPFQAIECQLYGVSEKDWLPEALNYLYEICFLPDTNVYRELYVNVISKETAPLKNTKYSVALVDCLDEFKLANQVLIDSGFVAVNANENLNDVLLPTLPSPVNSEVEDVSDWDETEEEHEDEEEMKCYYEMINGVHFNIPNIEEFRNWLKGQNADTVGARPDENDRKTESRQSDESDTNVSKKLVPMKAVSPVGYCTPNVLWHQTDDKIYLVIQLTGVIDYTLLLLKMKTLVFRATVNKKDYKLNIQLFDAASSRDLTHKSTGTTISVIMTKKTNREWPRLTASAEKFRNIKYDLSKIPDEDEEDGKKKKRRFLELEPEEGEDKDEEPEFTYVVGSDDYSSSVSDDDSF